MRFLFIVAVILLPAVLLVSVHFALNLPAATTIGIFTGMSNNTPALASVLDQIYTTVPQPETAASEAVVGFSVVYPLGVLGRILVIAIFLRLSRVDFAAEAFALRKEYPIDQDLQSRTIIVTESDANDVPLRQLLRAHDWDVVFGRIYRQGKAYLIGGDTRFQPGDQIVIAGMVEEMDRVEAQLGVRAAQNLFEDQSIYMGRRLFVSNPDMAGKKIVTLALKEKYGAIVSHVRRGDVELLAFGSTVLELGDRVRVLAPRDEIPNLVDLFGDSYAELSRINLLTVGLGITLGLLIGLIPIPFPGGITFQLGVAGGPLLVALILGALRRTGPILWTMPYSANLTLRQFGLICLLATIGVRSGSSFVEAFRSGEGWFIFWIGLGLILVTTSVALLVGAGLVKIPTSLLLGMISPQPAVLDYAEDQTANSLPTVGYTLMFPFAIIINVIVAQLLFIVLQNIG